VANGVTEGGLAVITPASAQKQHTNRQSSFGPTCRLVSSPEAGPGAIISTLEMGYPLLQYEGAVSIRLSLVAWRTTHDPTTRTAPGPPRGRKDNILQGINGGSGPPRESVGPLHIQTGPPGRVQDPRGYRPDPRDGSRTSLCRVRATLIRVPGFWDEEYPGPNQGQVGVRSHHVSGPYHVHFCSPLRRRPDAATWPTAHDVSQRVEPDVRPPGRAALHLLRIRRAACLFHWQVMCRLGI
jgi:hypothetical protein